MNSADIIQLQETPLNPKDHHNLQKDFPNWKVYFNNQNSKSQGNAILISPLYKSLNIIHQIHQHGASHSLIFSHVDPKYPTFEIFNIYLPSGNNWSEKIIQLKKLENYPTQDYSFLTGDWNFVESPDDTASASN